MARQNRALSIGLLLSASLAGCGLPNPYRAGPAPEPVPANEAGAAPAASAPGAPQVEAPATREYHLGAAAESLVGQAHAQIAHGELPSAAVTLERALPIEPANPLLWLAH